MPLHKIVYEFEATVGAVATSGSKAGWTESWYDAQDTDDASALQRAGNVADRRRLILTPGWSMQAIRVSQWSPTLGLQRRGLHLNLDPGVGVGLYPDEAGDEQPYDALVISWNTLGGLNRPKDIRGIPNDIVNAGGRYLATSPFPANFERYAKAVSGIASGGEGEVARYGFKVRTKVHDLTIRLVFLDGDPTEFAAPRTPVIRVTPVLPVTSLSGQTISISGVAGMPGLRGEWVIDFHTNATTYSDILLKQKRGTVVVGTYEGGGKAAIFSFGIDRVSSGTPSFGSSRKTGRPTQQQRGRSSRRT